jgi:CBS domain containing-hemolysin-like protein
MPLIAGPAYVMHRFFTLSGMVPALKFFSNCFNFLAQTPAADSAPQRQYIRQMVHDTREEGVLSPVQVDIIERLINIPSIQLASVMVPIANVRMISITANRPALQEIITQTHFRYFPVYRASRTDIAGLIDLYQVLNTNEPFDTIERFVKPLVAVSADSRIIEALNRMRNEHLEMILVCRYDRAGHCVPIGIATIRDLVEELIGEWAQW